MKRLVLFDIDGTILHGGKLWRECFEGALQKCFPDREFIKVPFNGKTDRQICKEMLATVSSECDWKDSCIDSVIDEYLARVKLALNAGRGNEVVILPGVVSAIEKLATHPAVQLGLLTGNVHEGAHLKLSAVGLDHFFPFGAFGDDHWDRYQLPRIAVDRAHKTFGTRYEGKEVVIVGDTVHDVNCGKSIGVRAIAVGTGRGILKEELLNASPDFYFDTLEDTNAVLRAVLD